MKTYKYTKLFFIVEAVLLILLAGGAWLWFSIVKSDFASTILVASLLSCIFTVINWMWWFSRYQNEQLKIQNAMIQFAEFSTNLSDLFDAEKRVSLQETLNKLQKYQVILHPMKGRHTEKIDDAMLKGKIRLSEKDYFKHRYSWLKTLVFDYNQVKDFVTTQCSDTTSVKCSHENKSQCSIYKLPDGSYLTLQQVVLLEIKNLFGRQVYRYEKLEKFSEPNLVSKTRLPRLRSFLRRKDVKW